MKGKFSQKTVHDVWSVGCTVAGIIIIIIYTENQNNYSKINNNYNNTIHKIIKNYIVIIQSHTTGERNNTHETLLYNYRNNTINLNYIYVIFRMKEVVLSASYREL